MSTRTVRMKKELESLLSCSTSGIKCWCVDNTNNHLEATIQGTDETPYAGGTFKLEITIPERYPFEPPSVKFITPVYHPNIDQAGRICLDMLKMPPNGGWKPTLNVLSVLTSIIVLMNEPNPDDPLMTDISDQFRYKPQLFAKTAKDWTQQYAIPNKRKAEDHTDSGQKNFKT